jgi:hypothetical protein
MRDGSFDDVMFFPLIREKRCFLDHSKYRPVECVPAIRCTLVLTRNVSCQSLTGRLAGDALTGPLSTAGSSILPDDRARPGED